jgi:hypothetical protein
MKEDVKAGPTVYAEGLQEKAAALGIAITAEMTEEALEELIAAQEAVLADPGAEAIAAADLPGCFGELFDAKSDDCILCACNAACSVKFADSPAIEAKAAEAAIEAEEAKAAAKAALKAEAKKAKAAEAVAKAEAKKAKAAAKTATPQDPKTAARSRAKAATRKVAAFLPGETGALEFQAEFDPDKPSTFKEGMVVFRQGDKVKVDNPRSRKFHGAILVVSHYSEVYQVVRCNVEGLKWTADFKPQHLSIEK